MKFYDCATAPSPRRVRVFLAEKGITLPTQQVDLRSGEQFGAAYRAINPDCTVPALLLDSGTVITDVIGICRYFEETQPEPRLMGSTAEEKAVIETWQRWCEREGLYAAMDAFRNATPGLKNRALPGPDDYEQLPGLAERGRARLAQFYARLDRRLGVSPYVGGQDYSIADITAMIGVEFAGRLKVQLPLEFKSLARWSAAVNGRPSAKA